MQEIWKDIPGYYGLYQASNMGRIKSMRYAKSSNEHVLSPSKEKKGYLKVQLQTGVKSKSWRVHRLVALTFIPNHQNFKEVNHKDGNKENNSLLNLEWCDRKQNINHAVLNGLYEPVFAAANKIRKPITAINIQTNASTCFESIREACRTLEFDRAYVMRVLSGKNKQAYGYIFKYC